jgi:inhibitor of cysteine peptidase
MSEIVIVQSDRGTEFEAHPGDLIVIRLPENPTTGYRWELDAADDRVIALQDSDYSAASSAGIGGGGTRTFGLEVHRPGTVHVQLRLRREWEPEQAAVDCFEVTIRVREA